MKSTEFMKLIKEDATGMGTGSIAVSTQTLGEKGAFTQKQVNKRLGSYTNQLSAGGIVKGVKAAKVK